VRLQKLDAGDRLAEVVLVPPAPEEADGEDPLASVGAVEGSADSTAGYASTPDGGITANPLTPDPDSDRDQDSSSGADA
jgi:DNA gyrase subunit A